MAISLFPSNLSQISGINPEIDLLLSCGRIHTTPLIADHIKTLLRQKVEWDSLIELAKFHKVIPLLYRNLNCLCPELVPEQTLQKLKMLVYANTFRNLFLTQELLNIIELFKQNGIPAIAFKGHTLAISAYQDLSSRQITDLDLLLPKRGIKTAQDLLISEGFQLIGNYEWEFHFFRRGGNVHIDLHQEIAPKFYGLSYDFDELLSRTKPLYFGNESIPLLTVEDSLLLVSIVWWRDCAHLNSHFSLHLLCDIDALIIRNPQLDWSWVCNQANTMGCDRILRLALTSAHNFLGTDFPTEIRDRLAAKSLPISHTEFIEYRLFAISDYSRLPSKEIGFWEFLWSFNHQFYLQTRERLIDKTMYCLHWLQMSIQVAVTPNAADWNLVTLPKALYFLYYPLHILRLLLKHILKYSQS